MTTMTKEVMALIIEERDRLAAENADLLAACRAALNDPPPVALRPGVVKQLCDAIARR